MSDAENLPVNPDEIFIINEKEYRSFYEDAYKKILQPKYLVQTAIVLPFQIPLDEGASFSVVGKRNICTFHFTTIKLNLPANHGVIDKNSPKTTYYKSRVEMIFVSPKLLDINKRHSISDCIDILLDGLNDFLMAYLIMTKDADVYRISREMFSTLIIVRLLQTDNWHRQDAIFIMHLNEPWERPIMHREDQHN